MKTIGVTRENVLKQDAQRAQVCHLHHQISDYFPVTAEMIFLDSLRLPSTIQGWFKAGRKEQGACGI